MNEFTKNLIDLEKLTIENNTLKQIIENINHR